MDVSDYVTKINLFYIIIILSKGKRKKKKTNKQQYRCKLFYSILTLIFEISKQHLVIPYLLTILRKHHHQWRRGRSSQRHRTSWQQ